MIGIEDRFRGAPQREAQESERDDQQKHRAERLAQKHVQRVLAVDDLISCSDGRERGEAAQDEEDGAARGIAHARHDPERRGWLFV